MAAPRSMRLLTGFLLAATILGGITITQPAAAAATWTTETIPAAGGVTDIKLGVATNDTIGAAYWYTGTQLVGFSSRSTDGVWTERTSDISGNGTKMMLDEVGNAGGATWFILAHTRVAGSGRFYYYRSLDGGNTWAVRGHSCFQFSTSTAPPMAKYLGAGRTGIVIVSPSAAGCSLTAGGPAYTVVDSSGTFGLRGCSSCTTGSRAPALLIITDNKADAGSDVGTTFLAGIAAASFDGTTVNYYQSGATGTMFQIACATESVCSLPFTTEGGTTPKSWWTVTSGTAGPYSSPLNGGGIFMSWASASFQLDAETTPQGASSFVHTRSPTLVCSGASNYPVAYSQDGELAMNPVSSTGSQKYMAGLRCGASTSGFLITYGTTPTTIVYTDTTTQDAKPYDVISNTERAFMAYTDGGLGNAARIISAKISEITPVGSATATRTFTTEGTAMSMAVDPSNKLVVVRFDAPSGDDTVQSIQPFSPTLNNRGSPVDTDCNSPIRHGLIADVDEATGKQFVGIIRCSTDICSSVYCADRLTVLGGDLANADMGGSVCENTDFCCDSNVEPPCDINLSTEGTEVSGCSGEQDLPGGIQHAAALEAVPLGFQISRSSAFSDSADVGFAFNDWGNGNVGYWWKEFINNGADHSCEVQVPFTSDGATTTLCSWRSTIGNAVDYIAASGPNAATSVWWVNGIPNAAEMRSIGSFSLPDREHYSIACAEDVIVGMKANGAVGIHHAYDLGTGTNWLGTGNYYVGTIPTTPFSTNQKTVAISQDGNVLAFHNGTSITIAKTTAYDNQTKGIYGNVALPSTGTFIQVELDSTGKTLWVLTTTKLERTDCGPTTYTCPNPDVPTGFQCTQRSGTTCLETCQVQQDGTCLTSGDISNPPTTTPTTGPGSQAGNLFRPAGANIPAGFTAATFDFFLAIMLIFGLTAGAYFSLGKTPLVAGVGAAAGFLLSYAFGLLNPWVILFMVLLAAAIFVLPFRGSGTAG